MKKKMKIFSLTTIALFAVSSVSSAVRIFDNSLPNQAAVNYDNEIATHDHLILPSFYGYQKQDAVSAGFKDDNTLFFAGRYGGLPVPLYAVYQTYNNSSVSTDTTNTNAAATTDNNTKLETIDRYYRFGIGTQVAGIGIQLITDLKRKGNEYSYVNNKATGATYQKTDWEYNNPDSPNRFGLNVGSDMNGLVWSFGVSMDIRQGSSYAEQSADGTYATSAKNALVDTTGTNPFAGATGLCASAGLGAGCTTGVNGTIVSGTTNAPVYTPNSASTNISQQLSDAAKMDSKGLTVDSFGWVPLGLIFEDDVLGWVAHYDGSTVFGQTTSTFTAKSPTNNANLTSETKYDTSGSLGTITGNVYYSIVMPLKGKKGRFVISPDVLYSITSTKLTVSTTLTGTNALGATYVAGDATNLSLTKSVIESKSSTLTLSLPVIFKIGIWGDFDWIAGFKMDYNIVSKETTSTSGTADTTDNDETTQVSKAGSGTTTTKTISTGFTWRAADNLQINGLMSQTGQNFDISQMAISAQYFFGGKTKLTKSNATAEK